MTKNLIRKLKNLKEKLILKFYQYRAASSRSPAEKKQKIFIESFNELYRKIENYTIISFDIFDTALFRKVQSYDVAREIKEIELARYLKMDELSLKGLWSKALRVCSEKPDVFSQEELYRAIINEGNLKNINENEILRIDISVEKKLLYANPLVFNLIKYAQNTGKRIIFISDMYFEEKYLNDILSACGYPGFKLYVSASHHKSKQKGDLFHYVAASENTRANQIFHIGDNYKSDILNAQQAGFKTFYFDKRKLRNSIYDKEKDSWPHCELSVNEKLMTGLARHYNVCKKAPAHFNKTIHRLGYEVVGPVHLMYLFWITRRAQAKKINTLFFLSRDGYYLQRSFNKINHIINTGIKGKYTFASRRLYTLPYIKKLDNENLEILTKADQQITVNDLFKRLEIPFEDIEDKLQVFGFSNPEEILTDFRGYYLNKDKREKLKQFFSLIEDKVLEKSRKERELLLKYYCDIGLDSKHSALVDVGWNASSLFYINRLLKDENREFPSGFYFGTWQNTAHLIQQGFDLESFFVHLGQPRVRREIITGNIAILELFFTAPHPSITGLKYEEGWKAIYEKAKYSDVESTIVESLFAGVEQFIDDALQLPGLTLSPSIDYIQVVLEKLVGHPEYRWARDLGKFGHKISFGSVDEIIEIAPEPNKKMSKKEKAEWLSHSLWHNGTLAMLKKQ